MLSDAHSVLIPGLDSYFCNCGKYHDNFNINDSYLRALKTPRLVPGGRGHRNPSQVLRVPLDCFWEFDELVASWRERAAASPTSPRFQMLNQFLDELDGCFPEEPKVNRYRQLEIVVQDPIHDSDAIPF